MATVTETIGVAQDRLTIALWESNVGVFGTDTYEGLISTDDEFDEQVQLQGSTGTPSITSYLHLTVDPANRHAGVQGTGHARISRDNPASGRVIEIDAAFTRVSWLEVELTGTGVSDEAFRILGNTISDVLIQYCIVHSDESNVDQDTFYVEAPDAVSTLRLRIDNCIIHSWGRHGLHIQNATTTNDFTFTGNIDHCAWEDFTNTSRGIAIFFEQDGEASDFTITIHNTWATGNNDDSTYADSDFDQTPGIPDGTMVWNGSHNLAALPGDINDISGTDNTTNWQFATDGIADVTKTTGSWVVVNSLTDGSEDLLLLDDAAGNLAAGNGTNRQGSEPDARQDFSVDITGATRPTTQVDIGPHQVTVVAAAPVLRRRQLTTVRM